MSMIMCQDSKGKPKILIHAPDCKVIIRDMDLRNTIIEIDGVAGRPFIQSVRFIDCTIKAKDLSCFGSCYFDGSCEMDIANKKMMNHNVVIGD